MSHVRSDSMSSSEGDPLDEADSYYGATTNPGTANKSSKFGRHRTFSVLENKSRLYDEFRKDFLMSSDTLHEVNTNENSKESSPKESSPVDEVLPLPDFKKRNFPAIPAVSSASDLTTLDEAPPCIVPIYEQPGKINLRRSSMDASSVGPKKFYINNIEQTLKELLDSEDTDNNIQITIEDTGPKVLNLGTVNLNGYRQTPISGTYMLSNLLQELTIAKRYGRVLMILDEQRLNENPMGRMKRMISTQFWKSLTREISPSNIMEMAKDTKFKEEYVDENGVTQIKDATHRIYVPYDRKDQYDYFMSIKGEDLDVQYLPKKIDAAYIRSINDKPGLLALAARPDPLNPGNMINEPYVVPGGRFNELYGWDSYMETIGLLTDVTAHSNLEHLRLARGMTENFIYEIHNYGKILNANRLYYLGRSQPPFLTDMTLRVYKKTVDVFPERKVEAVDFLKRSTLAAIKEYNNVWCCEPRLDIATGLSCYHPEGLGVPPETEATHFDAILAPFVHKHGISQDELIERYNLGEIKEEFLDEYFLHDRAVRESGHDTSYRLEGKAAHLATVDLNALLYKYEVDISKIIQEHFIGELTWEGEVQTAELWEARAIERKANVTKYLWNQEDSIFYDYNVKTRQQTGYESATTFWPLWSEIATKEQAERIVKNTVPKLEEYGGLVAGTLSSRGDVGIKRPSRQWDFPFGWAPQQILAWIGLANYGYEGVARRLAYRWLFMMTKAFVDYNGVVVEKYNVTKGAVAHRVDAEYGNQGLDFKGVATEGFGWVNASYVFGLTFLNLHATRCLGTLTPPDVLLQTLSPGQKDLFM